MVLRSARAKLICALVLVVACLAWLIHTAVSKAATYYLTVHELYQQGPQAIGEEVTVSGTIVGASVRWNPASQELRFAVRDNAQSKPLPVVYHGDRPDDFTGDWPVVVTGRLTAQGDFVADKLLVKCPSKYEAQTPSAGATAQPGATSPAVADSAGQQAK
ncbi:MAG: cytochrome c maturation protein CcmE [Alicyclobacillus sp.]|nr:cytochrome c maturation protein CcmE [Alicyclobacillus sp.]